MQAVISHPLQSEHVGCRVSNMSQDGALLELPQAKNMPSTFWLRLEGEITLRLCTVAWRSERHLGIEFSQQVLERRSVERKVTAQFGFI